MSILWVVRESEKEEEEEKEGEEEEEESFFLFLFFLFSRIFFLSSFYAVSSSLTSY